MFRITYSSFATVDFCDAALGNLLLRARENNLRQNITGALLYREGRFIQVLEGPEDSVRNCYAQIAEDPRHVIHLSAARTISVRRFPTWTMGYVRDGGTFNLHLPEYDNPYESLPSKLADFGGSDDAELTFDWLFHSWLAPMPGPRGIDIVPAVVPLVVLPVVPPVELPSNAAVGDALNWGKNYLGKSDVVTAIVDKIMQEIHSGTLRPGDRVNDTQLAKLFGTSRTPVREAIQKLREIGVVEVAANRFTRIAVIDHAEATEQIEVWAALYSALLDEVLDRLDASVIDGMVSDRGRFLTVLAIGDPALIASATTDFFLRLVAESNNSALRRIIRSTMNVIKIASTHFDALHGSNVIAPLLDEMIAAAVSRDTERAKRALREATEPDSTYLPTCEQPLQPLQPSAEWTISDCA